MLSRNTFVTDTLCGEDFETLYNKLKDDRMFSFDINRLMIYGVDIDGELKLAILGIKTKEIIDFFLIGDGVYHWPELISKLPDGRVLCQRYTLYNGEGGTVMVPLESDTGVLEPL